MAKSNAKRADKTPAAPAPGTGRKGWPAIPKSRKVFRLESDELVYKLRMVLEDSNETAAKFIEPLIAPEVDIRFAALQEKLSDLERRPSATSEGPTAE